MWGAVGTQTPNYTNAKSQLPTPHIRPRLRSDTFSQREKALDCAFIQLPVHYWVPNAYSPKEFCEVWIIYGIKNGNAVELFRDENYSPTRREIAMVYNESYRFALREDQTISGANYYELIIHYPNNVTDTSMYENYNYIQLSEDNHVLRVWTISGDYVDISF